MRETTSPTVIEKKERFVAGGETAAGTIRSAVEKNRPAWVPS
ncbi:MAG: hypothetical protein WD314_16740 [Trueperaceae bacterium]